jgi:hypothetical protein
MILESEFPEVFGLRKVRNTSVKTPRKHIIRIMTRDFLSSGLK